MSKYRILLDSNAYLRLANSFHPLLYKSFGNENYTLYLIPEFQKEFNKNPRLKNKFGWVNQPEYIENRKHQLRTIAKEKNDIKITYSYLWAQNISEGFLSAVFNEGPLAIAHDFRTSSISSRKS